MPRKIILIVRKRARRIMRARVDLSKLLHGLGRTVDVNLDFVPMDTSKGITRIVRKRTIKMLQISGLPHEIRRGLGKTLDISTALIPMDTPIGIARIVHQHAIKVLNTEVGLSDIQRGLEKTLDYTRDLIPLDSKLLIGHGAARNKRINRQLAWSLAFVAGAVNAGGFLAVHSYTSHVTGVVSRIADELILGNKTAALMALGIIACFFAGSFTAGLLISLGRRHRFRAHYAFSLMFEASLLMLFGLMGATLHQVRHFFVPGTIALLSFIMGMHNSVVTTISNAEVRTTHLTGIITDLGVEFSRLLYFNVDEQNRTKRIQANIDKLRLHGLILLSFFGGGLVGALSFKHLGFKMTIALAIFLFLLAWRPVFRDLRIRFRVIKQAVR